MTPQRIDLNCDLGEISTDDAQARDLALLDVVTSANIACGGHAGDADSMRRTVHAALVRGVAIGAHPSYPDRENFGRTPMHLSTHEVQRHVFEQLSALASVAASHGARISHVKPHGALYHAAMNDPDVATAIVTAARGIAADLTFVGLARATGLQVWASAGCRIAAEYFADRQYEPDGSLRSRSRPGALIANPPEAAAQAIRLARGHLLTSDPTIAPIAATLCVHSDTPESLSIATAVRRSLTQAGIQVNRI